MADNPVLKDISIVNDVLILKKRHKLIRKMQRNLPGPEIHGYQVWGSSFLIMDYLLENPPKKRSKMTEIGCGWGILGISCAQHFKAKVTAIDADEHVFPYLEAHALLNDVKIKTRTARYEHLKIEDLQGHSLMLGGDICFWDTLVKPLFSAINAARDAGVGKIIIADPGRPPFHKLAKRCQKAFDAELISRQIRSPKKISGELLIISQ
ncbi:methyltransferase [Zhongshania sp.]|uniref:class I SAM-dependent methyltransferase n=1 Tax=Zhongshania sp. TaxID=1971902 RepID=UPI003567FF46